VADFDGVELRNRRMALGLTQAALAEMLGVSPNTVARWERGALRVGNPRRVADRLAGLEHSAPPDHTGQARARRHNLPVETSSFVGRETEIGALGSVFDRTRLLTLVGPGGVGKTRLALRLVQTIAQRFADGADLVELASVSDPGLVPDAVAATLRVRGPPHGSTAELLTENLAHKHTLLLLDNCEHLLEGCAELAYRLLRGCPELRVVATSRQPLGVHGEFVWQVPPLQLEDAERLFVERATSTRATFDVAPGLEPLLVELCRRLDGLPLAIELAAVRARALGLTQIAARLDDRFRLLAAPNRSAPLRHQTLHAAIDWSYDLLSAEEQTLFNRLAVFSGGWTLDAAEQVCGADDAPVFDLLERLVERSLVGVEESAGVARYSMLETLREYAAERLAQSGEHSLVRERHRAWCVQLAAAGAREMWRADQLVWVDRLRKERDNIRAALTWTLSGASDPEPGVRLAAAMVRFWDADGDLREGAEWLSSILAVPGAERDPPVYAQAVTALGYLSIVRGEKERAIDLLDRALPVWRAVGDPRSLSVAVFFRGVARGWYEMPAQSEFSELLRESLELARIQGPRWIQYMSLLGLGEHARMTGDLPRAEALLSEGLALAREQGERWGGYHGLTSLALLALRQHQLTRAMDCTREALRMATELDDPRGQTYILEALAAIAVFDGRAADAVRIFGAAERHRAPMGELMMVNWRTDRERGIAEARARLDEATFADAWSAGAEMSLEQAVAFALESGARPRTATRGLTPRELDVLRLVAQGKTNREIGTQLVVSHRTIKRHLDNIFGKLGVSSRSAATAAAIRGGLV
jgi:predicted ATPase/DNA-binding CsgD family transcriptional regulator